MQFIHHKFLERIELDIDGTSGHVWSFKNTTLEENEYLIDWFLNFSCHPGKVTDVPNQKRMLLVLPHDASLSPCSLFLTSYSSVR